MTADWKRIMWGAEKCHSERSEESIFSALSASRRQIENNQRSSHIDAHHFLDILIPRHLNAKIIEMIGWLYEQP